MLRAREGLPGADEGYLWYGTLRVLAGEVPLRDIRSYEPGRYYWCAGASRWTGPGVVGLRASVHAFFACGVLCGLLALRLDGVAWPAVGAAALLLGIWAHPGYKLFEPTLLLAAVLAGTELIVSPGWLSELGLGAVVGIAGFFGMNLALYSGAAAAALTLLVLVRSPGLGAAAGLGGLAAGLVCGSLPLCAWFRRAPGTFSAFWERRVRAVARRGTTNLPISPPWPWRFTSQPDPLLSPAGNLCLGLLFTLLPLLGAGIWLWAALVRWPQLHAHPALVAGAAVGLPALHHAFSRADLDHLAPVVIPFIIVLASLSGHGVEQIVPLLVLGPAGLLTVVSMHPRLHRHRNPRGFHRVTISSSRVWADSSVAHQLGLLAELFGERLDAGEPVVVLPTLAALLPLLGRRSGVYDTFCVYPAPEHEQQRMLHSLERENIRLVVVQDLALDDRENLRFPRTHPRVWQALQTGFERLQIPGLGPDLQVFWRDAAGPPELAAPASASAAGAARLL